MTPDRTAVTPRQPAHRQPPAAPAAISVMPSPVGPIRLTASQGCLIGLHLTSSDTPSRLPASEDGEVLRETRRQIDEYFAGDRTTFDLPLLLHGTPFQAAVWNALCDIPFGQTRSYRDIARAIGAPRAVRAVGAANGKNPVSIIVPCHRVIGSDGRLTGYGWGVETKSLLLDLEAGRAG